MEKIISRIKKWRNKKGYTYETMGYELNISPAAYRKIEMNQTKLTVERLLQIVKILDIKLEDVLGIQNDKRMDNNVEQETINAKIELLYRERIEEQAMTINQLIELINKINSP